jgi:tetratricopeptide (TPR) repeat protein
MPSRREFLRYASLTAAYLSLFGIESVARAAGPGAEDRIAHLSEQLAKESLPANERLNTLLKLAREYHLAGRYPDETATLKQAFAMEDLRGFRERFARFNYGKALYKQKDFVGAMLTLGTLADQPFKYRAEVLVIASRAALAARDWERCAGFLDRLLKHYPNTVSGEEALYLRGVLEVRRGRPKHAVDWLERAAAAAEARVPADGSSPKQPLFSRLLALIEVYLASQRNADAERVVRRLIGLARRDALLEMETRFRAGTLYWGSALAREVVELMAPIPELWRRVSGGEKTAACKLAPRAMTLAGMAWRALGERTRALDSFAVARQLAVVPPPPGTFLRSTEPSPESEIILPLKAQTEMALEESDEPLLQDTLAEGDSITAPSSELRELYDVEVGKTLQEHDRVEEWVPMSEEVADGGFASLNNQMQEHKDLAGNSRKNGDFSAAADRVAQSLATGALAAGSQAEFDTRLLLVGDLDAAGRSVDRDAQLATIDARISTLPEESERRWWSYRAGKTLLKLGDTSAARTRLSAVRSSFPGSLEAKKALFALAELEEKEGEAEAALGHYVDYINSYPGEKPYLLQAAHRAYDLAVRYPGMTDAATLDQLVTVLVADLPDNDWKALMRAAQFLYRRGDTSRADSLMTRSQSAMEAERSTLEVVPLSAPWVSTESRYINALYQMGRHADIVQRVETQGVSSLYPLLTNQDLAKGVFTILFLYVCSLLAVGRGADATTVRTEVDSRSATLPARLRAAFEAQAIHDVWHAQTFAAAEPFIEGFLRSHPTHFQSYNFLLLWSLALITDEDYSGALQKLAQAENFRPKERGPASQSYLANVRWLKGFCLDRLGQPGAADLMTSNTPQAWVVSTTQNGLPRR